MRMPAPPHHPAFTITDSDLVVREASVWCVDVRRQTPTWRNAGIPAAAFVLSILCPQSLSPSFVFDRCCNLGPRNAIPPRKTAHRFSANVRPSISDRNAPIAVGWWPSPRRSLLPASKWCRCPTNSAVQLWSLTDLYKTSPGCLATSRLARATGPLSEMYGDIRFSQFPRPACICLRMMRSAGSSPPRFVL